MGPEGGYGSGEGGDGLPPKAAGGGEESKKTAEERAIAEGGRNVASPPSAAGELDLHRIAVAVSK